MTNQLNAVQNFFDGKFSDAKTKRFTPVVNPSNGEVIANTPMCELDELDIVVKKAQEAYGEWSKLPVVDRVQPLYRMKELLEKNSDEIARLLVLENGKTFKEAKGDLLRGLQMVEVACGMPSLIMGEFQSDVARGIDSHMNRRSMGVFACIGPFNFPAMIPFWFWPFAVACGNTMVIKPSERVPLTQMKIFELIQKAGFPPNVLNMVHGGKEIVNGMLEHPLIKGISFVGSTPVAKHIYTTGAKNGKRVQALGGAKNYMVILPDAPIEKSVQTMIDSCLGCAGERCLAGSVLIGVGPAYDKMKVELLSQLKNIKVGDGLNPETSMGPVISAEAKERIVADIEQSIREGAKVILDGREHPSMKSKGFFLGPTVLDQVKPGTLAATKEIFGPVISLMKVNSMDEAIEVINQSNYANTTSLFTSNGGAARDFANKVDPAMVGINLGVPAPMAFFSFGGSKDSFFGDIKAHGKGSIEFFTEKVTVMTRWFHEGVKESVSPQWDQN